MEPRDEHPIARSDSWTPSNLNLSAQGVMVEEARADGCAWSPSYLNLNKSDECMCPPGQPMLESPHGQEQETRSASMRPGPSVRTIGEGDQQQSTRANQQRSAPVDLALLCTCKKSRGGGEEQLFVHSSTPSMDRKPEPSVQRQPSPTPPLRCVNVCPPGLCKGPDTDAHISQEAPQIQESQPQENDGRGGDILETHDRASEARDSRRPSRDESTKGASPSTTSQATVTDKNVALEDVYVWEARSYTGSAESEEMEKLRLAGRAPMPIGPGERSEEELSRKKSQEPEYRSSERKREAEEPSPPSKEASETQPHGGGKDDPEHVPTALEDVYVWEARSYTGSADSDAMEELRLAGKSPMPKGPGERSEVEESAGEQMEQMQREDAVPDRSVAEKGGGPLEGRCFPTCPGQCSGLRKTPSPVKPPSPVRPPPSVDDGPRRPCGCRASTEQLPSGAGEQGGQNLEKKKCLCDSGEQEPHPKCICKHCQKQRKAEGNEGPLQPQWDYQLSAEPYSGPCYQPGDEKGFPDVPPGGGPDAAGGAATGGQKVCPPCPDADAKPSALSTGRGQTIDPTQKGSQDQMAGAVTLQESASAKCFCKPSVHDRVEYLTNLLRRGISPLRQTLEEIEKKMRAMGFSEFGSEPKPLMGGSGGISMLPHGGASSAPGRGENMRDGKEPAVAIYIMTPNAAVATNAPQMLPGIHGSHPQPNEQTANYDQQAGTAMQGKRSSCRCLLTANRMHNLGTVMEENEINSNAGYNAPDDKDKVTFYLRGNFPGASNQEVCCQIPCCQHRPRTAQPYSKP